MFNYKELLEIQRANSQINPNVTYLTWLYKKIRENLNSYQHNLEIGAGAGISADFLENIEILKTDILSWEGNSVRGDVDAEKLPFKDCEFSNVIALDVLHHTNSPYAVINESLRVLRFGGNLVIVEPFVSVFSFGIYKLFHHEDTSWKVDLKDLARGKTEVFHGDQGISKILFGNKKNIEDLQSTIHFKVKLKMEYISILSFFATGGLSKPIRTPKFFISTLIKIEDRIPQFMMKFLSSRILVVITKIKENKL